MTEPMLWNGWFNTPLNLNDRHNAQNPWKLVDTVLASQLLNSLVDECKNGDTIQVGANGRSPLTTMVALLALSGTRNSVEVITSKFVLEAPRPFLEVGCGFGASSGDLVVGCQEQL